MSKRHASRELGRPPNHYFGSRVVTAGLSLELFHPRELVTVFLSIMTNPINRSRQNSAGMTIAF